MAITARKLIWTSKTFWFGLTTMLFGAATFFFDLGAIDLPSIHAGITTAWGFLAIVLRLVTKEKVVLVE